MSFAKKTKYQFNKDPRKIQWLVIDSETDDVNRLLMRPSWGQSDRFSEGRSVPAPGAGLIGPITGHRIKSFVDKVTNTMTTYYFDHLWLTWRKSVYHFPPGTVFANAGAITYNSNSSWRSYKSFHRFAIPKVHVITID